MAQSDHKTAESSESSEERGMLFVASQESAVITEPGNGALDDPSAAIAAQRPAILSQVLGPTVGAVRRDHFDAQFCEGLIQDVAIITLVSDEAFWLKVSLDEAQGLLDHRGLTDAGCIQRESQGNSLGINHKLHLGSFTFAHQTNGGSSALGRGKSGIHSPFGDPPRCRLTQRIVPGTIDVYVRNDLSYPSILQTLQRF